MNILLPTCLFINLINGFFGIVYYGTILKAKVLTLLAFKLEHWSFILKANFGHRADTHSQFCQKKCYFGAWYPIKRCANSKKNFKSKKLVKWSRYENMKFSFWFYFDFFDKKLQKKLCNFWFKLFYIDLLIDSELWENFE